MKSKYEVIKIKGKNPYCNGKVNPYVEACDKLLVVNELKFPCKKKDIKCIKKIYISANIESIKIVSVPVTNVLAENEIQLKERKLYIVGNLIEKIEYITFNSYKKQDELTAKIPFTKYISIECNYVQGMNDYCVTPIIKNICAESLNKRCIKQQIELILSAYKKDLSLAEININSPLSTNSTLSNNEKNINLIDFYGENDLEVAKVQLDIKNKIIKATSTNITANLNFDNEKYFEFLIKDSKGNIKIQAVVMGNETGENFSQILNNYKFDYNDILVLNYEENNRVKMYNLPKKDYVEYIPEGNSESYVITSEGLILVQEFESEVINSIIIKGKDSEFMAQINLINAVNRLQVVSTSKIINDDFEDIEYFAIVFNDIEGNLKKEVILNGNENSDKLVKELNDFNFEYDDSIILRYKQSYNISITNFQGKEEYNPTGNISEYTITPDGLTPYEAIGSKLLNSIILNGKNSEPIVKIDLVEDANKILVMSSGILVDEDKKNEEYFSLILKDSTENVKIEATIRANENANNFAMDLDGFSFDYNDIIELKCNETRNVMITNFQGKESYNLIEKSESYAITISGLEKVENILYY
ncbi:putative mucin/carbohydrate-binding domain-containing protein [Clostridium tarantellae]|uniref:Putative mucin/carbohydrate-binding domain-containing protein n=1 Tax=Clostridium tarantellae TaxID=39493 RepID=A0A6I1MP01_9CLOT|nr:putative mucin/carbohydrate-binding domain-containing protein [Clostridium tarantellae]MPQ43847.1 hypothetical protein [Clostridium tarantellae]